RYAYANMGALFYVQGRYAEAAKALESAVRLDPRPPTIRYRYLGDTYRQLGEAEKSRQTYLKVVTLAEDALKVNPRDVDALSVTAACEPKPGLRAAADLHLAQALSIAPRDNVVLYRKATVHALRGERTEGLAALDAALKEGYSPVLARQETDLAPLREAPGY